MTTNPADATGRTSTHEKFNSIDTDVTFQSSDGVQFRLLRKYLEANTGAFPGPDDAGLIRSDDQTDVVHLTEPAEILEVLFEFVYPRRHPDLEDMQFEKLAPLAEAVEKYEVFSAMTVCQMRLKPFVIGHPLEILSHSIKHDLTKLINEAALGLCRTRTRLNKILEFLPARAQMPWVRYHEAWSSIFDEEIEAIMAWSRGQICPKCRDILVSWTTQLERKPTLALLQFGLDSGLPLEQKQYFGANVKCNTCPQPSSAINIFQTFIKRCREQIAKMPPFIDFLKDCTVTKQEATIKYCPIPDQSYTELEFLTRLAGR